MAPSGAGFFANGSAHSEALKKPEAKPIVLRLCLSVGLVALGMTGLAPNPGAAAEICPKPLTIRVANAYPPFSVRTDSGGFAGYDGALIEQAM
ncbi:MAG: hypothetical protein AAF684_05685, partial [Pseudomonadota bacterium]